MNRLFRKTPHYNTPFSNNCALLLRLPHSRLHALISHSARKRTLAQRGICADLPCSANPPTGIARRAGRSPSEARKLPEQKPRSPRGTAKFGKPLRASPWEWGEATSPAGCFGGDARGAEKGAQPHNRPRLAPAGGGPSNRKRKASVPAGHKNPLSKDKPCFIFFRAPVAHAP